MPRPTSSGSCRCEAASTVHDPADRADVVCRYEALRDMHAGLAAATAK
ncbi:MULTISPECIES: hypothetical protein [unclassified Streptomyces]|nr:hypothetical protein [Streptomyces sp. NBC_00273]